MFGMEEYGYYCCDISKWLRCPFGLYYRWCMSHAKKRMRMGKSHNKTWKRIGRK